MQYTCKALTDYSWSRFWHSVAKATPDTDKMLQYQIRMLTQIPTAADQLKRSFNCFSENGYKFNSCSEKGCKFHSCSVNGCKFNSCSENGCKFNSCKVNGWIINNSCRFYVADIFLQLLHILARDVSRFALNVNSTVVVNSCSRSWQEILAACSGCWK